MALKHKTKRRLSLVILIVALPVYILVAVVGMTMMFPDPTDRPPVLVELLIYIVLGVVWAFPLKRVFMGVGQADQDAPANEKE